MPHSVVTAARTLLAVRVHNRHMTSHAHTAFFRGGEGEPLVLLNGPINTWRSWEMVLPHLTPYFDVLAASAAGNAGGPPLPSGPVNIDQLTDSIEAVMDEQGLPTAHLAGYSGGGWLAMELARRGRARSVWAFSPAGGWQTDAAARRGRRFFAVVRAQNAATPGFVKKVALRSPVLRKLLLRGTAEHGDRMPYESMLRLTQEMKDSDWRTLKELVRVPRRVREYENPGVPVTIAWAARDHLLPVEIYGGAWKQAAPFAVWETVPGVGHMPTYDDPALVASLIRHTASGLR